VQTLDEVLVDLQHNATTECQSAYRSHYNAMIRRAHLTSRDRESCEGLEQAIVLFKRAIKGLEQLENEVAQQLGVYQPDRDSDTASISADTDDFIDDDEQDRARPEARGGKRSKAGELKSRLRDCLTLQHTAHFFLGNVFFTVGNRAKEEMDAYSTAATIRKKILSPQQQGIQRATKKLLRYFEEDETDLTDMEVPFATERPGIKTRTIFEDVSATSDRLNAMAELVWEWREQLVQMLAAPISNLMDGEDDEANGDTYDADAQAQEALEVLLDQYKQALADWKGKFSGDSITSLIRSCRGRDGRQVGPLRRLRICDRLDAHQGRRDVQRSRQITAGGSRPLCSNEAQARKAAQKQDSASEAMPQRPGRRYAVSQPR
jgi:hypothetical protein